LGPLGAVLSDLILQMLGFAAVVFLLAPMFWALELLYAERVVFFRPKLAFYPVSVLLVAGALSTLPAAASWPLHHGYGGILGDVVSGVCAGIFGVLNPERATLAAGILLSFSGVSALTRSIGVELRDVWLAVRATVSLSDRAGSWHKNLRAEAQRLADGGFSTETSPHNDPSVRMPDMRFDAGASDEEPAPEPARRWSFGWPGRTEAPHIVAPAHSSAEFGETADLRPPTYSHDRSAVADDDGHWTPAPRGAMTSVFDNLSVLRPGSRDADAEPQTGPSSRSMAERFAPFALQKAPAPPAPNPIAKMPFMGGLARRKSSPAFKHPSVNMLKRPAGSKAGPDQSQTALRGNARLLEDVLADYGVKGEVRDIKPGPVVTLFEYEPARGTKSARVIALADDIARSMSAISVRAAVVPGRNAIGLELPNVKREPVLLREMLECDAFRSSQATLPLALGKSIGGEPVIADLARMPHLLVAGTTGSGKSVGVNAMILSLLYRHTPEDLRFLMIDPKMLELSVYNGIPHLLAPVVTEPHKAVAALNWAVSEMEERYKRMSTLAVRNIEAFNTRVRTAEKRGERLARTVQTGFDRATGEARYERQDLDLKPMPYIVVVVDEFADLMIVAGKDIEQAVQRLAQMARAAGIHLIMATQRPSVDIITGTIKANFPTRISFKVTSKIDSRTILNDQGAEQLLGQGDMLFSSGSGQMSRVHGPFVSDEEVEVVARYLREQGEPQYIDGITDGAEEGSGAPLGPASRGGNDEDLYDRAVAIVLRDRKASTSYLQRRLSIGYNKAADLIERMEREGRISPANPVGKREILSGSASAA
jgi:DNA segregation ATPase FtsK/SpoIIIE, S-DNA-T family